MEINGLCEKITCLISKTKEYGTINPKEENVMLHVWQIGDCAS